MLFPVPIRESRVKRPFSSHLSPQHQRGIQWYAVILSVEVGVETLSAASFRVNQSTTTCASGAALTLLDKYRIVRQVWQIARQVRSLAT